MRVKFCGGHVKGSHYPSSLSKGDSGFNLLRVRLNCIILMVMPLRVERLIFECMSAMANVTIAPSSTRY